MPGGGGLASFAGAGSSRTSDHDELHRTGLSPSERPVPFTDQLRLAVAAYLACWRCAAPATRNGPRAGARAEPHPPSLVRGSGARHEPMVGRRAGQPNVLTGAGSLERAIWRGRSGSFLSVPPGCISFSASWRAFSRPPRAAWPGRRRAALTFAPGRPAGRAGPHRAAAQDRPAPVRCAGVIPQRHLLTAPRVPRRPRAFPGLGGALAVGGRRRAGGGVGDTRPVGSRPWLRPLPMARGKRCIG